MMHGTTNIKFIDAQQAKLAYQSKAIANKKRNCCICWTYFTTIKHNARNHKY